MPQNPTQVLVGLNSGQPTALAVNSDGQLETIQSAVTPTTVTVSQTGGTITTGGSWQAALAANADRAPGGAICNLSASKAALVFFGAVADATNGKAITVAAGATLSFETVLGRGNAYPGVVAISGPTTAEAWSAVEVTKAS